MSIDIDITLTESAKEHLIKMIEKEQGNAFRLSITKTGCSGYAYAPSIIKEAHLGDTLFQHSGLTIFIDTAWLHLLQGLHIDYLAQENSPLKQKKLVFTNAKEKARCGCGESFHVE
jgi:iron-sulfur cluster assembly protein